MHYSGKRMTAAQLDVVRQLFIARARGDEPCPIDADRRTMDSLRRAGIIRRVPTTNAWRLTRKALGEIRI